MSGWLAAALALAGVAALLVAMVPRRWLGRAIALWLVSPVFAYAGLVVLDWSRHGPTDHPIQTAVYGFMLISPILVVPWVLVCLLGFGAGLIMRGLVRGAVKPMGSGI